MPKTTSAPKKAAAKAKLNGAHTAPPTNSKPANDQEKGHISHTHDAGSKGLPGQVQRPIKITMLGAGSAFTPRLMNDILRIPGEAGGQIVLVDIDPKRLKLMHQLIMRLTDQLGKTNWKVTATQDRLKALPNSDYIVSCIEVSGTACVRYDNDIPAKYGIDQCIGDTIGPGGLFKGLRTIPVFLQILRDAEALCPNAIVLNYTNPMGMMVLASGRTSSIPVVGLCHSVQGTSHLLAKYADVNYEEMKWECAGINHLAWFTKLEHKGKSLYPKLRKRFEAELKKAFAEGGENFERRDDYSWKVPEHHKDIVRKDMMLHFGAFITESSGHLSEYLPYYRKRKDILDQYARPGYDGASSFYADNWPTWRTKADESRNAMLKGEEPMDWKRSWEYASWIIEAREKDSAFRIHGNVLNNAQGRGQLITNLPADGCVEVACLVDQNGVQPVRYGELPAQMAALCSSNMSMIDLAATAAMEKSKEAAIYSLMLDPLTAAVCSPAEIQKMALEMFEAEAEFLPDFK